MNTVEPIAITPIDIAQIRRDFATIAERVSRKHEGTHPISTDTAKKTTAYIDYLEDRVTACGCADHPSFVIKTKNSPLDAHFQLARLRRMRAEDAEINKVLFGADQ